MSLAPGGRLGPYEITAKLGEGGMGEVYRATDSKLKREVAIKVLPAAFAEDKERLARFEREAQVLAQLHHPNIASIFGLEESSGVRALVMELVEGEDLSVVMARGPVPLGDALAIAIQIAEALEAAHERGIVHRDLKPQNVKLTVGGGVKVLDFGLAKAMDSATASASAADPARSPTLMNSPTLTSVRGTQLGMILGTAAYMAPEQARGGVVDKRADIWAFGVVLFELLVGRSLFGADTVSDTLAGVLKTDVDWEQLPANTPPAVRQLLRRCLERNPRNRLHDIADARLMIVDAQTAPPTALGSPGPTAQAPPGRGRALGRGILAFALGALAIGLADRAPFLRHTPADTETLRLAVLPPAGSLSVGVFDLSSDGRSVVYAAASADGSGALYLRALDALEARKLPGTDGGEQPFFSPDGRSIGFFADKKLLRIDLAGGPPRELAVAASPRGGSWGSTGVILFAGDGGGPLYKVPAAGGEVAAVTHLDAAKFETSHRWPHFLPDGVHFVYLSRKPGRPRLALEWASLDGHDHRRLIDSNSSGRYGGGRLFFQIQNTLFAQSFDPVAGTLAGEARPVAEEAWLDLDTDGMVAFAVADSGRLAYRGGGVMTAQISWLGRDGRVLRTVGKPGSYACPALAPDERHVAVSGGPSVESAALLFDDVSPNGTMMSAPGRDVTTPLFSPDGSRLVYSDDRNGPFDLFEVKVAEPGRDALVLASPLWKYAESWSPDGRLLAYSEIDPASRSNLWILPRAAGAKPYPFLITPAAETSARFSPDGKFIAYVSDDSGSEEVFVQPFPPTGAKWQVSPAGGFDPEWRSDGREIFYLAPDAHLMSLAVTPSNGGLTFGAPESLFRFPLRRKAGIEGSNYVASRDGQRFLALERPGEAIASPIVVVIP